MLHCLENEKLTKVRIKPTAWALSKIYFFNNMAVIVTRYSVDTHFTLKWSSILYKYPIN